MLEERSSHLTIIVGASDLAEHLRRSLVQSNVAHAGITTHLRGLRQAIVLGADDLVVLCIALDQPTLNRHGQAVRAILEDHHCFSRSIRSVGLLTELGLTRAAAELGCDVYVHDSNEAAEAVRLLTERWISERQPAAGHQAASGAEREIWIWGKATMPEEFVPVVKDERCAPLNDGVAERQRSQADSP